jgi:thioredoxin-related protein
LDTWFTKVLFQSYDSVKVPVFQFIEDVKPHEETFRYVVSYFLNNSFSSKVMGMDALFVDIAKEYYLSEQTPWASEDVLEKIRENVVFMENSLVGKTAPDLNLETFDGEYASLHGIRAKYTLLLFYEPHCSYCRIYVPAIYKEIYHEYREKGLEVFAVYSAMKKEEWQDFLIEHELFDWVNVWDEHHDSRFRILYDVRSTPGLFLLDENKTILGKKLTVQQIKEFMEAHLD